VPGGAGLTGPNTTRHRSVAIWTGVSGTNLLDTPLRINETGGLADVYGARSFNFWGEYLNPTTGATMIINLDNGQKQYVPVGTATSLVMTGATGPGNYMLRIYHYNASSLVNWPTGVVGRINWQGQIVDHLSSVSGAIDLVSIYAVGPTGPNNSNYYAQSALGFA
jgi:hypothetical protein